MTDTLTPMAPAGATSAPVTWTSSGDGLWAASRCEPSGVALLGFVEQSLEEFVAVDSAGASLGRFADLETAQAAFVSDRRPAQSSERATPRNWSGVGATLVPPSRLRLG